jgi:cytochrome c553
LNNRGSKGKTIAYTQTEGYDLSMKSLPKYLLGMITLLTPALPLWSQTISPEDRTFFEQKVRPLLVEHCYSCHSVEAKKSKGGLRLDSAESITKGGETGAVIIPGKPEQSLLIKAVHYRNNETLLMPPKGKLQAREIATLEEWVKRGAYFPASTQSAEAKNSKSFEDRKKFWSFQPLAKQPLPKVKQQDWPRTKIDSFLLAEQEKRGLKPSPQTTPAQFLRRITFDLTGLPPTPAEIDAFKNPTENDYKKLVDRLLASPHYGERWGRTWLDLARYCDILEQWAETKGQSYLYRDWVVKAINDDLGFDKFSILQLAADQLNSSLADRAALGFMGLSPSYWKELQLPVDIIKTVVAEEWEERVHTLSSTFLGLNVACARCHDHKFDPITAKDYYSLAGIVASTRPADISMLEAAATKVILDARKKVTTLEADLKKLQAKKPAEPPQAIADLKKQIEELKKNTPNYDAPFAVGMEDASLYVVADGPNKTKLDFKMNQAQNLALHVRGNPNNTGAIIPRQFLSVFSGDNPKAFNQGSGRLELANALFSEAQSLTARVIVNRIWKHHFGKGLVETPSDFGFQGDKPSHPELLDDLALRLIENNWSMKWLHREIVLSATYRQQSTSPSPLDQDNRLLASMPRKRLDVEGWRDAMLAVSGNLDPSIGGAPIELNDINNRRRTIYGLVRRRELSDILRLHDFPDPITHSPNRVATTTPLQQLYTLNSPFIQKQANLLYERLQREFPSSDADKITGAYRLLFSRNPTSHQLEIGLSFVKSGGVAWNQYTQALLGSNEFVFID